MPLAAAFDEGWYRSLYFNWHAMPVLVHYRLIEWYTKEWSDAEQVWRGCVAFSTFPMPSHEVTDGSASSCPARTGLC